MSEDDPTQLTGTIKSAHDLRLGARILKEDTSTTTIDQNIPPKLI